MATVKELQQERHAISLLMREQLDSTDPGATAKWKELAAKHDAVHTRQQDMERQATIEAELNTVATRAVDKPNLGTEAFIPPTANEVSRAVRKTPEYGDGFRAYLKTGTVEARAALSVSADGVLIPQGFQDNLEIVLKAYSRMRNHCTVITTETGNTLPWPVMDDTANSGSWLAEAASMNATSPTFTNVTLGAALLSSDQVLCSVQALQDFAFSPEAFLTEAFGIRLGRGTNKAYTVGDGTATYGGITGLLNALVAAGGRSYRLIGGNSNSGNAGDTNLNSIGTDDFDALISALDPAYRPGAMYMANQATWDKVRMLKDKYGRPIWQVSLAVGLPDTINGYPYDFNQDLPLIGAGLNPIIFGQFKKYIVRDVLGITAVRFNELYMANHQIGFAAFLRTYGILLQPKAFVYGNTSAS
jgi:HK97 family phage major capsid protein